MLHWKLFSWLAKHLIISWILFGHIIDVDGIVLVLLETKNSPAYSTAENLNIVVPRIAHCVGLHRSARLSSNYTMLILLFSSLLTKALLIFADVQSSFETSVFYNVVWWMSFYNWFVIINSLDVSVGSGIDLMPFDRCAFWWPSYCMLLFSMSVCDIFRIRCSAFLLADDERSGQSANADRIRQNL